MTDGPVIFDTGGSLCRTAASTLLLFFFVWLMVRLAGKRTTSKMNNFDWIVTVAIGSITASAIMLKDVVVADAVVAVAILVAVQYELGSLSCGRATRQVSPDAAV